MKQPFSRRFLPPLALAGALLFSQSSASALSEGMGEFMTTLDELSKSSVVRSDDSYLVNDLFLSIVRQNPAVMSVAKIAPDGTVTNRVTDRGVGVVSKNVSGERWYSDITATLQPHTTLWTETGGGLRLLCAWPLIDESAQPPLLAGIFSVKINVRTLVAGMVKSEDVAVSVLYDATVIFSRGWREGEPWSEDILPLTKSDRLTVRYQETGALPLPTVTKEEKFPVATAPAVAVLPTDGKRVPTVAASASIVPIPHQSRITDSFLLASDLPVSSSVKIAVIIALAALTLIAVLVGLVAAIRMMREKHDDHGRHRAIPPGPIDAIMIPGESGDETDDGESPDADSSSAAERETKQLPVLRELIAGLSQKLKSMDSGTDPAVKARLLREINENLSLWVSTEIGALSGHLSGLAESIRACEVRNGQLPELQVLRYEIERIIEDLQGVDRKIPHNLFT